MTKSSPNALRPEEVTEFRYLSALGSAIIFLLANVTGKRLYPYENRHYGQGNRQEESYVGG